MTEGVRERAIGTWRMISIAVGEGAGRIEPYGPTPNGLMVIDASGWFTITITRPNLPAFASGNREQGTDAENRAVVQGAIAYFGTYAIDEQASAITCRIEGTIFPNYLGQTQTRRLIFDGDTMTYVNDSPSGGGGIAQAKWRRVGQDA
jgi:Lipocalin-like domain